MPLPPLDIESKQSSLLSSRSTQSNNYRSILKEGQQKHFLDNYKPDLDVNEFGMNRSDYFAKLIGMRQAEEDKKVQTNQE